MKILFFDFKWSYGIEKDTRIFSDFFRSRGHEVTLLGAKESQLENTAKFTKSAGMRQVILDCVNPLLVWRIFRQVRDCQPDVVYIMSTHPINSAVLALVKARMKHTLIISHIHDPKPHNTFLITQCVVAMQKAQMTLSDLIVCFGEGIKSYLQTKKGIGANRIFVIPNSGYGTAPAVCDTATGDYTYISLIGRFENYKGIDVFLKAAAQLDGELPATVLLAGAGGTGPYETLIKQVKHIEVQNRFISDDEMMRYIRKSYALVLPYVGGVLQSGLIASAYSQGCPVIVSDNGCLRELVVDGVTGRVVPKKDASSLAEAMRQMSDVETRQRMKSECLSYYEQRLGWERCLTLLEQNVSEGLNSKRLHVGQT